MRKPRIGFVGLGTMGLPMAARLHEAGYPLMVYNRTDAKSNEFARQHPGAHIAPRLEQISQWSELIILMLPDSLDVEEVVLSTDGLIQGLHPRTVVIDMSSVLPSTALKAAEAIEAKRADFLDAPVSGSQPRAEDGTLSIMVGGKTEVLERVRPVLEVLGTPELVGPAGAGQRTKLNNQVRVASNLVTLALGILDAQETGADPAAALQALQRGLARTEVSERKASAMLNSAFVPAQFKAKYLLKDLSNAAKDARQRRAPWNRQRFIAGLQRLFKELVDAGFGDEDCSAIIRVLE